MWHHRHLYVVFRSIPKNKTARSDEESWVYSVLCNSLLRFSWSFIKINQRAARPKEQPRAPQSSAAAESVISLYKIIRGNIELWATDCVRIQWIIHCWRSIAYKPVPDQKWIKAEHVGLPNVGKSVGWSENKGNCENNPAHCLSESLWREGKKWEYEMFSCFKLLKRHSKNSNNILWELYNRLLFALGRIEIPALLIMSNSRCQSWMSNEQWEDGTDESATRRLFVFRPGDCVKTHKLQNQSASSCPAQCRFIYAHYTTWHVLPTYVITWLVSLKSNVEPLMNLYG